MTGAARSLRPRQRDVRRGTEAAVVSQRRPLQLCPQPASSLELNVVSAHHCGDGVMVSCRTLIKEQSPLCRLSEPPHGRVWRGAVVLVESFGDSDLFVLFLIPSSTPSVSCFWL